jgi:hypothetical protein
MPAAAALASALVEVAQVRYSRSGIALRSWRKNQENEARGFGERLARVCAMFSVTPKRNSAPVEATRIS